MESEISRWNQLKRSLIRISDILKENRVNGLAEYFHERETSTNLRRLSTEAKNQIHVELLMIDHVIMVRVVSYSVVSISLYSHIVFAQFFSDK